jgi:predicted transposase YdaD
MELKNPHDALFKETLSDRKIARSFFETYLPADLLSHIDLEGLDICKESFVEEELREVRKFAAKSCSGRP